MSRCNKICLNPNRAEIDDMLAHSHPYREISERFPEVTKNSLSRYVKNGCPGGGLPTRDAIKQEAAKNNKIRAISGIAVVQGVLDDITSRLSYQRPHELNPSIVAALRLQLEAAKMLGVSSQSGDEGAISAYVDQLRIEEDKYQEEK